MNYFGCQEIIIGTALNNFLFKFKIKQHKKSYLYQIIITDNNPMSFEEFS